MKIISAIILAILSIFLLAIFTNIIMSLEIFPEYVQGNIGNWIGFYGTIIGGLLTLAGVFLTIQFNKGQFNHQESTRKEEELKNKNLNTIKNLWEIELNLTTLNKDLDILAEYIKEKINTIDVHEYAHLINGKLDNNFYKKGIKPTYEQIKIISGEIGFEYTYEKFTQIQDQLLKTKERFDNKNLQVKSAEVDWDIYGKINSITNDLYEIFDTLKCVTTIDSNHLSVFKSESELILKKINGMMGIGAKISGYIHLVREKRNKIEKQYFNIS